MVFEQSIVISRIVPESLLQQWSQHVIGREMETLKMMIENNVDLEAGLTAS